MVRETRESHPRQSELIVTHARAPHLDLAFLCLLVAVFMHRVPTLHVLFLLAAGAVIPGEVPPAGTLFVFFSVYFANILGEGAGPLFLHSPFMLPLPFGFFLGFFFASTKARVKHARSRNVVSLILRLKILMRGGL